ncbi:MAG: hypothetical protein Q9212_006250 [Teloschistes hypoglaucus]
MQNYHVNLEKRSDFEAVADARTAGEGCLDLTDEMTPASAETSMGESDCEAVAPILAMSPPAADESWNAAVAEMNVEGWKKEGPGVPDG